MFNAAVADTVATALEAIARGLREGVLLSSAFDLKHIEESEENDVLLTVRFIDLTVSRADDVEESTSRGPRAPGPIGPVGQVFSILTTSPPEAAPAVAANACPACGSAKTVDTSSKGHEGERLCISCNNTWAPARATGA